MVQPSLILPVKTASTFFTSDPVSGITFISILTCPWSYKIPDFVTVAVSKSTSHWFFSTDVCWQSLCVCVSKKIYHFELLRDIHTSRFATSWGHSAFQFWFTKSDSVSSRWIWMFSRHLFDTFVVLMSLIALGPIRSVAPSSSSTPHPRFLPTSQLHIDKFTCDRNHFLIN